MTDRKESLLNTVYDAAAVAGFLASLVFSTVEYHPRKGRSTYVLHVPKYDSGNVVRLYDGSVVVTDRATAVILDGDIGIKIVEKGDRQHAEEAQIIYGHERVLDEEHGKKAFVNDSNKEIELDEIKGTIRFSREKFRHGQYASHLSMIDSSNTKEPERGKYLKKRAELIASLAFPDLRFLNTTPNPARFTTSILNLGNGTTHAFAMNLDAMTFSMLVANNQYDELKYGLREQIHEANINKIYSIGLENWWDPANRGIAMLSYRKNHIRSTELGTKMDGNSPVHGILFQPNELQHNPRELSGQIIPVTIAGFPNLPPKR